MVCQLFVNNVAFHRAVGHKEATSYKHTRILNSGTKSLSQDLHAVQGAPTEHISLQIGRLVLKNITYAGPII